jgi:hypothetical protein
VFPAIFSKNVYCKHKILYVFYHIRFSFDVASSSLSHIVILRLASTQQVHCTLCLDTVFIFLLYEIKFPSSNIILHHPELLAEVICSARHAQCSILGLCCWRFVACTKICSTLLVTLCWFSVFIAYNLSLSLSLSFSHFFSFLSTGNMRLRPAVMLGWGWRIHVAKVIV